MDSNKICFIKFVMSLLIAFNKDIVKLSVKGEDYPTQMEVPNNSWIAIIEKRD